MGGYYSSRWHGHISKCPVEQCLTFDLKTVPMSEYMTADENHMRSYDWTYTRDGKSAGSIGIVYAPERMQLVFVYTGTIGNESQQVKQPIVVSTTPLNLGGVRYWIHCPHCNRRTRTLHKPPSRIDFRCRQCWNLTYQSVQEAHKWDRGSFITMRVLLDTEDRLQTLYRKLGKTRGNSKQRRRLQRLINKYHEIAEQQLDQQEAANARMRQRVTRALEVVDPEAARAFMAGDD